MKSRLDFLPRTYQEEVIDKGVERYYRDQQKSDLRVGDTVKVIRSCNPSEIQERGWLHSWSDTNSKMVGKTSKVTQIHKYGINIEVSKGLDFTFPFFVLMKV